MNTMEDTPRGMDRVAAAAYIGASPTTVACRYGDGCLSSGLYGIAGN